MVDPLSGLKKVGQAKLKVLFWDVYNSSFYNQTGEFQINQLPQALRIDYLRDIQAKDLVKRTEDEWEKLGIKQALIEKWSPLLSDLFPNIKKGDTLILQVSKDHQSEFFFNGKAIGNISDPNFGLSFLRIWLDEQCSYPLVREKLLGLNK